MAGLGLAAVGYGGRYLMRRMPNMAQKMQEQIQNLPKFDAESFANSKYYKGGKISYRYREYETRILFSSGFPEL